MAVVLSNDLVTLTEADLLDGEDIETADEIVEEAEAEIVPMDTDTEAPCLPMDEFLLKIRSGASAVLNLEASDIFDDVNLDSSVQLDALRYITTSIDADSPLMNFQTRTIDAKRLKDASFNSEGTVLSIPLMKQDLRLTLKVVLKRTFTDQIWTLKHGNRRLIKALGGIWRLALNVGGCRPDVLVLFRD